MKETGIIMSGNHPKLILDGIKTQTRRVIKPQPDSDGGWTACVSVHDHNIAEFCPYGQVGDRLWVRETWWCPEKGLPVAYKANLEPHQADKNIWKPSMFMPRWASRITLEITEVRVERLQEISFRDCEAEGIYIYDDPWKAKGLSVSQVRMRFARLWDSLNAKRGYGWEVNPWVWGISFRKEG